VLLLDEPTDGLDPVVRSRTLAVLAEHLADSPTSVLVATHQIHEFETLADYVGILRDGSLIAQLSRDELPNVVGRYRVEVPERWTATRELRSAGVRGNPVREAEWTLVGHRRDLIDRLTVTGALVHSVRPVCLDDAVVALIAHQVTA
jgi:ABC-2 type transport system ATP-binding protein